MEREEVKLHSTQLIFPNVLLCRRLSFLLLFSSRPPPFPALWVMSSCREVTAFFSPAVPQKKAVIWGEFQQGVVLQRSGSLRCGETSGAERQDCMKHTWSSVWTSTVFSGSSTLGGLKVWTQMLFLPTPPSDLLKHLTCDRSYCVLFLHFLPQHLLSGKLVFLI